MIKLKSIILIFIGIVLIGFDVWLYLKAQSEGGIFVLFFGIGSAIVVPVGVWLISYALGEKHREAIKKLAKVPEIGELVARAETQEQKIKVLTEEYEKLQKTIHSESERLALITRKHDLEKNAKRILKELDIIESEIESFDESIEGVPANEVRKLRERVQAKQRGDVVIRIGRFQFIIEREQIVNTPVFGYWLYLLLKFVQDLDNWVRSRSKKPPITK